jgi:hypothetical protein
LVSQWKPELVSNKTPSFHHEDSNIRLEDFPLNSRRNSINQSSNQMPTSNSNLVNLGYGKYFEKIRCEKATSQQTISQLIHNNAGYSGVFTNSRSAFKDFQIIERSPENREFLSKKSHTHFYNSPVKKKSLNNRKLKKINKKQKKKVQLTHGKKHMKKGKISKAMALSSSRNNSFGLKEISKKVREIVKKCKRTTYKDISDKIVNEINECSTQDTKDEKNIRRRIYDSLNVMKAMKLFQKDKTNKNIIWNGDNINENDSDCEDYRRKNYQNSSGMTFKKKDKMNSHLEELMGQIVNLKLNF